jgi:hypothetical protein
MALRVAPIFLALVALLAQSAFAYSGGVPSTTGACSGCHTGGSAPSVSFRPQPLLQPGGPNPMWLAVRLPAGDGLGFRIEISGPGTLRVGDAATTRLEHSVLTHQRTIAPGKPNPEIPFSVQIGPTACGGVVRVRAEVAAVNRNGAPSGDGVASASQDFRIDCPRLAPPAPAQSMARPTVKLSPSVRRHLQPSAKTALLAAGGVPLGERTLATPVVLGVSHREAGRAASLSLSNPVALRADAEPAEADFAASVGNTRGGSVVVSLSQEPGRVIVDCIARGAASYRIGATGTGLELATTVAGDSGNVSLLIPAATAARRVSVTLEGVASAFGSLWTFQSCELTPVR